MHKAQAQIQSCVHQLLACPSFHPPLPNPNFNPNPNPIPTCPSIANRARRRSRQHRRLSWPTCGATRSSLGERSSFGGWWASLTWQTWTALRVGAATSSAVGWLWFAGECCKVISSGTAFAGWVPQYQQQWVGFVLRVGSAQSGTGRDWQGPLRSWATGCPCRGWHAVLAGRTAWQEMQHARKRHAGVVVQVAKVGGRGVCRGLPS